MRKNFLAIISILLIILAIIIYFIYNSKVKYANAEGDNKIFTELIGKEILGTEIGTLINKTIDINEKNRIKKDEEGFYIENDENSIKLSIYFKGVEDPIKMEKISKADINNFLKVFNNQIFKVRNIEYHEKTKNVKHVYLEEI